MKLRRLLLSIVAILALSVAPVSAAKLTVYSPAGTIEVQKELAPRLPDLNGKRIALWLSGNDFGTGKSEMAFTEIARLLKERFPSATILPHTQFPIKYDPAKEVIDAVLAAKPDAVIIGLGG